MFTAYDKAIAAFITSLLGLLAAFNIPLPSGLNETTILAITPFITLVVTWLVPNKSELLAGAASKPGPTQ